MSQDYPWPMPPILQGFRVEGATFRNQPVPREWTKVTVSGAIIAPGDTRVLSTYEPDAPYVCGIVTHLMFHDEDGWAYMDTRLFSGNRAFADYTVFVTGLFGENFIVEGRNFSSVVGGTTEIRWGSVELEIHPVRLP